MPKITVTLPGTENLLKTINPSSVEGPDEIPARDLRETATSVTPILASTFQQLLDEGIVPKV